jgi:hypothetical protein
MPRGGLIRILYKGAFIRFAFAKLNVRTWLDIAAILHSSIDMQHYTTADPIY